MSQPNPIHPVDDTPSEATTELVAYLDNELDADARREVEKKLSRDEQYRLEMQQLQKAWDMLECLPRTSVDESFATTTVEMVALSADEDVQRQKAALPARRRRQWMLGACGVLVSVALGFVLASQLLPNANDELAKDLDVLEHLDELQQVGDTESLRLIHEAGLFSDIPDSVPDDDPVSEIEDETSEVQDVESANPE
jgi:anti-sigma factor RsiW